MESRGIDANFSFSNRFVPHSRTRTSGKQRLESRGEGGRGGKGVRGGWPCVGSRTAIPDMAISHNERQWCPRLETQRGRQLINSSLSWRVLYAEFSRPAPRFGSVIAITRTIIWGIKKHGSDASVRMEGGREGWGMKSVLDVSRDWGRVWGNRIWGIEGFWRC